MSLVIPPDPAGSTPSGAGLHVAADEGIVKWFNGDIYSIKLRGEQANGAIGLVEAHVPPGGGPPPHIHAGTDETFYVLSGDLEFLNGDEIFTASAGDVVHIPRGTTHRFHNPGILPAELIFIYTPGGAEGLFIEGGDDPKPGVQVQPWGPERIDERMLGLLATYDTGLPPSKA
jgi:mannose-6-phosphate isomerase-like protein (cupin superfamily)